jgi:hypothetical protein
MTFFFRNKTIAGWAGEFWPPADYFELIEAASAIVS